MSPRTGRPIVGNPKTYEVKARLDEETHKELEEYCKKNSVTKTEVVRIGLKKVLNKK